MADSNIAGSYVVPTEHLTTNQVEETIVAALRNGVRIRPGPKEGDCRSLVVDVSTLPPAKEENFWANLARIQTTTQTNP